MEKGQDYLVDNGSRARNNWATLKRERCAGKLQQLNPGNAFWPINSHAK